MDLSRFQEFYERFGFWKFWFAILAIALAVMTMVLAFTDYIGPYLAGLWLIYG